MHDQATGDGWFVPWEPDAKGITSNKAAATNLRELRLVMQKGLSDFLGNPGSPILVVAGSRGVGKTTVLAVKAAKLLADSERKNYRPLKEYKPFINGLVARSVALDANKLSQYATHLPWTNIWKVVLGAHFAFMIYRSQDHLQQEGSSTDSTKLDQMVQRIFGVKPDDQAYGLFAPIIKSAYGHTETIGPALGFILKHTVSSQTCRDWFVNHVAPSLGYGRAEYTFTLFVDAIDECLGFNDPDAGHLLTNDGVAGMSQQDRTNVWARGQEVWLSAQTGFVDAAYDLREQTFDRCWAYGTIRGEAYARHAAVTTLNESKRAGSLGLALSYSSRDLQSVFQLNVEFTPPEDLAVNDPQLDPAMRLFGLSEFEHPRVRWETESVVDALIRHTLGTPRDLIVLAKAAKDAVPPKLRASSETEMSDAVHTAAQLILRDYVKAVFPLWDKEYEEKGYVLLTSNVLSSEQMRLVERQFAEKLGRERETGLLDFLYARGLVGVPAKSSASNLLLLQFHTPDGKEISITRPTPYVVLHPALSATVFDKQPIAIQEGFYSSALIVGHGLPALPDFPKPPRIKLIGNTTNGTVEVRVDGTTLAPPDSGDAELLLYAMLSAIARRPSRPPDQDVIAKEVKWLCETKGLYAKAIRGTPTDQFVKNQLSFSSLDKQSHLVKAFKSWMLSLSDAPFRLTFQKDRGISLRWKNDSSLVRHSDIDASRL